MQFDNSYKGQFLIAMPNMQDPRFERALIYICGHDKNGTMGLVINQVHPEFTFMELVAQLELLDEREKQIHAKRANGINVYNGGPVEQGRGFILHSDDYAIEQTEAIDDGVALTGTLDALKALSANEGPRLYLTVLGYASWSAGQLDSEIAANVWLTCHASQSIIFNRNVEAKYNLALNSMGVNPTFLMGTSGHA
jgi:putative transcriptional regulator